MRRLLLACFAVLVAAAMPPRAALALSCSGSPIYTLLTPLHEPHPTAFALVMNAIGGKPPTLVLTRDGDGEVVLRADRLAPGLYRYAAESEVAPGRWTLETRSSDSIGTLLGGYSRERLTKDTPIAVDVVAYLAEPMPMPSIRGVSFTRRSSPGPWSPAQVITLAVNAEPVVPPYAVALISSWHAKAPSIAERASIGVITGAGFPGVESVQRIDAFSTPVRCQRLPRRVKPPSKGQSATFAWVDIRGRVHQIAAIYRLRLQEMM